MGIEALRASMRCDCEDVPPIDANVALRKLQSHAELYPDRNCNAAAEESWNETVARYRSTPGGHFFVF
jgi:hypothetical protein